MINKIQVCRQTYSRVINVLPAVLTQQSTKTTIITSKKIVLQASSTMDPSLRLI